MPSYRNINENPNPKFKEFVLSLENNGWIVGDNFLEMDKTQQELMKTIPSDVNQIKTPYFKDVQFIGFCIRWLSALTKKYSWDDIDTIDEVLDFARIASKHLFNYKE